jgi:hypothetical protein
MGVRSTKMEGMYTIDVVDPSYTIISIMINLILFCVTRLTRPTRCIVSSGKLVIIDAPPNSLVDSIANPKGENNERIRSWGILLSS